MAVFPTGTVTFLFTDIEGSTERWEHHRAAMARALEMHNVHLRAIMDAHGGFVFKTMGDAFCVAFGEPAGALAAAIEAQRALVAEDWAALAEGFPPLRVRMALHTGPAELHDGDYVGPPVNRVSRLMSAAHGGQVLLSLAAEQLIRDDLPVGCALRDLGRHRLKDLRHSEHIYQVLAPGVPDVAAPLDTAERLETAGPGSAEPAASPAECPYRGLAAFREVDAPYFFGREAFTDLLAEAVAAAPMVGVIGPSGSGKSSVVFAGLVPRLRGTMDGGAAGRGGPGVASARPPAALQRGTAVQEAWPAVAAGPNDWTVLDLRPGARPFHALAATWVPLYERAGLTETDRLAETGKLAGHLRSGAIAPRDVLRRIGTKHPALGRMLLVVDQFEELYTLCPDEDEQRSFQDLLFAMAFEADGGVPLTLGLTLRADFMGHALAYRPFADAIQRHDVKLGPMNRDEVARAIRLPAEAQGRAFEPGLVERIADDVGEKAGMLPLLEFALTKLWDAQEHGWLTHDAYEQIGRVEGAVARHADAAYATLSQSDQALARRVFVQMVRPGEGTEDTRRVATRAELGDSGWALVRRLASARLVVTDRDEAGHETAEVVHEALIRSWGRLREWMNTDRRFRMWQERLRFALRQWEETGRDDGALLRGVPLAEAEHWRTERGAEVAADEQAFVDAGTALRSRREAEREAQRAREQRLQHRVRNLAAGVAAVAVVGLVISIGFARSESRTRRESQRLAMAAGAQTLLAKGLLDPALALAVEAAAGDDVPPEAELALADAAYAPGTRLVLGGFESAVSGVALSPDGQRAAAVSWDHALAMFDLRAGTEIYRIDAHPEAIQSVAFSPDGRYLLTGSWDNWVGSPDTLVVLRDAETGAAIRSLKGHSDNVRAVAFSPDGTRAISGSADKSVRLWDVATGEALRTLEGHSSWVNRVVFSPDGRLAASGSDDRQVLVWEVDTGAVWRRLEGHTWSVHGVAFTPDGRWIVSGSSQPDGTLRVWDLETGTAIRVFAQPEGIVDVALDAAGATAVLGLANGDIVRRHLDTGQEIARYVGHTDNVNQLAVTPDDRTIVSAAADNTLRVWQADSAVLHHTIETGMPVYGLAFSADGRRMLVGGRSPRAQVWDIQAGTIVRELDGHGRQVADVDLHPDGRTAVVDRLGGPALWDLSSGAMVRTLSGLRYDQATSGMTGSSAAGSGVVFSPDGHLLLRTGWNCDARVFATDSGAEVRRLSIGALSNRGAFSPDGSKVLVGSGDTGNSGGELYAAYLWDIVADRVIHRFLGHAADVTGAAFAPDGATAATVSRDRTLRLWAVDTGMELHRDEFGAALNDVAFSPDGRSLVVGGDDGVVVVWDVTRRAVVRRYRGHIGPVHRVAFSPDARQIASGSVDGTVRLWDLHPTLAELRAWAPSVRHVRALTCAERRAHRTPVQCGDDDTPPSAAPAVGTAGGEAELGVDAGSVKPPAPAAAPIPTPVPGPELMATEAVPVEAGTSLGQVAWEGDQVNDVVFDPRGAAVYATSMDGSIRRWDYRDGRIETVWTVGREPAMTVDASADGRFLVAALERGGVALWDRALGKVLWRTSAGSGVLRARFAADASTILPLPAAPLNVPILASDGGVRVHDLAHLAAISAAALSHDGRTLYTSGYDRAIHVWDVAAGKELRVFQVDETGHAGFLQDIAALPGGGVLAAGADGRITRWDPEAGAALTVFGGHRGRIWRVVALPAGDRFVSVGEDRTVRLWDVASGVEVRRFTWAGEVVRFRGLAVSPDGRIAASSGDDGVVRLWDISPDGVGEAVPAVTPAPPGAPGVDVPSASIAAVSSGPPVAEGLPPASSHPVGLAAPGAQSGALTSGVWDVWALAGADRDRIVDIALHAARPATGTLAVDAWVASDRLDLVLVLRRGDGAVLARNDDAPGGTAGVSAAGGVARDAWLSNIRVPAGGTASIEVGAYDPRMAGAYRLVYTPTQALPEIRRFAATGAMPGAPRAFRGLDLAHDDSFVVAGEAAASFVGVARFGIHVWDLASGALRHHLNADAKQHFANVNAVAVSPDDKTLLSGASDGQIILWSLGSGDPIRHLAGHGDAVNDVAFNTDGTRAISAGGDDVVIVWDVGTGAPVARLTGHAGDASQAVFDAGSRSAWSAGMDGVIVEWDLDGGSARRRFDLGTPARAVAVSPDGRTLAASGDETIALWDLGTGAEVGRVAGGHAGPIHAIAFSPDGRHLVTGGDDRTVRIWRADTLVEVGRAVGHAHLVREAVFTWDGEKVVSGALDGTVRVWDVTGAVGR